jgi:hypothetical protein
MDMGNVHPEKSPPGDGLRRSDMVIKLCSRSMARRIWETYADDLLTLVKWEKEGICSLEDISWAIKNIIPKLSVLKDNGHLARALERISAVIAYEILEQSIENKTLKSKKFKGSHKVN